MREKREGPEDDIDVWVGKRFERDNGITSRAAKHCWLGPSFGSLQYFDSAVVFKKVAIHSPERTHSHALVGRSPTSTKFRGGRAPPN